MRPACRSRSRSARADRVRTGQAHQSADALQADRLHPHRRGQRTRRRPSTSPDRLRFDKDGNVVGAGDMKAQAEQVFKNLEAALTAAGAKFCRRRQDEHLHHGHGARRRPCARCARAISATPRRRARSCRSSEPGATGIHARDRGGRGCSSAVGAAFHRVCLQVVSHDRTRRNMPCDRRLSCDSPCARQKQEIDHTGTSSTRLSRHVRSTARHRAASTGTSPRPPRHRRRAGPAADRPSRFPGTLPCFAGPVAIGAADPPIHAPAAITAPSLPNKSSSAGHRSGVSGRMVSFMPRSSYACRS